MNKVLSSFKSLGKELVSHPHSLIRGTAAAFGMTGVLDALYQANEMADWSSPLSVVGGLVGASIYYVHRSKEEKIKKEANLSSAISEYALTGVAVAAGVLGLDADNAIQGSNQIVQIFDSNKDNMVLTLIVGAGVPCVSFVKGCCRDLRFKDEPQALPAQQKMAARL